MTPRAAARAAAAGSEVDADRLRFAALHATVDATGRFSWDSALFATRAPIGGAMSGAYQADVQRTVADAVRGPGGRPYIPSRPEPGR